jgi:DME family drug/metabolite transporter
MFVQPSKVYVIRKVMDTYIYTLMVLLAAIIWGTTGTAQFFTPEQMGSLAIGAVHLTIGRVVLLWIVWAKILLVWKHWPLKVTGLAILSIVLY